MQFTHARVVSAPYALTDRDRELAGVLRSAVVRRGVWPLVPRTSGSHYTSRYTRFFVPAAAHTRSITGLLASVATNLRSL